MQLLGIYHTDSGQPRVDCQFQSHRLPLDRLEDTAIATPANRHLRDSVEGRLHERPIHVRLLAAAHQASARTGTHRKSFGRPKLSEVHVRAIDRRALDKLRRPMVAVTLDDWADFMSKNDVQLF